MSRPLATLSSLMLTFAFVSPGFAQDPAPTTEDDAEHALVVEGNVSEVTVYQGQAMVTRTVELSNVTGLSEIVVTKLPDNVIPSSLYAEPDQGVEIRSVRYRIRPVELDVRSEVRELDAQIQDVNDQIAASNRERQLLKERQQYLNKLEMFTAVTADRELKSGVLNAETLKELTNFSFEQRDEIAHRELDLNREQRDLQRELETLQRKRSTIAAGSAQNLREAVVFVNVADNAAAARLRLNYLVTNATWSPSYNLRANTGRDKLTVEYNAAIQQMSGENWTDVEMTLSTATPSLIAQAPPLETLVIKLGRVEPEALAAMSGPGQAGYDKAKKALEERRRQVVNERGNSVVVNDAIQAPNSPMAYGGFAAGNGVFAGGRGGGVGQSEGDMSQQQAASRSSSFDRKSADRFLNEIAQQMQILDYNVGRIEIKKAEDRRSVEGEGVSVSYRLKSHMTLPSRSDRQLIQISSHELAADFYRLATPVLTGSVFEETRALNSSDQVFLAGPVSTFLGDEFVGRGEVPTVSVGEKFSAGLGIDTSLRTTRELVDKQERIQGGNRVVDFTYELSIENFGSAPAQIRLLDRIPTAGEADIKITLLKSDNPVSDDRDYQQHREEEGLLRWDVEVPAGATGVDRFKLQYTMQIEYDKQLAIVGLPVKP